MKKLTVAGLLMFSLGATVAHAQSSVTIYGRLDGGIEYMNGVTDAQGQSASRWRAQAGDWGTSWIGLKGVEELGGGTQALFKLESGINVMDGTAGNPGGQFFQRYALVGLSNPRYGTAQVGRALLISNNVWDFDPFVFESWSAASLVRGRNWLKVSNSLNYQSPVMAGFDVAAQYALTNNTRFNVGTESSQPYGRSDGVQLTYTAPSFMARVIYDELRSADGKFEDLYNGSREVFVGGLYKLGSFKFQGAYTHMAAPDAPTSAPNSADHEWLGVTYQVNPVAAVTVGGYHINVNHGAGNATIYEAGGTYALSKRTFFYLTAATVRNSSSADFSLEAADENKGGTLDPENPLPGHSQAGFFTGIDHSF